MCCAVERRIARVVLATGWVGSIVFSSFLLSFKVPMEVQYEISFFVRFYLG